MKVWKYMSLGILAGTSLHVSAGKMEVATIKNIAINTNNGEKVFIVAEGSKDVIPGCHTSGTWTYTMPLDTELNKSMLSLLLAAKVAGTTVKLNGTSDCSLHASIETLKYIELK